MGTDFAGNGTREAEDGNLLPQAPNVPLVCPAPSRGTPPSRLRDGKP